MTQAKYKPVVQYITSYGTIEIGEDASVFALDHPRLGKTKVFTTTVLAYDAATGDFETLNTLYKLKK